LFVSPFTVKVKIALVPSTVAAITFESEPDCPVIVTVEFEASLVSPISKSMSFDEPVIVIEAVTVPQELLLPVLSQFKSTSFESPVRLIVPVYVAPLIWYVITFELPTWSMSNTVVAPVEADDVPELPIVC